ncbi:MAG: hypothetical protein QM739_20380 [Propionivibrio sp.]
METEPFLAVLEHSALALWLRTSLAYPVLESLHIIGLATMFGSLLIVDLRLLGVIRRVEAIALARAVLPWTLLGFLLVVGTGLCLFFARASELIANPFFLAKISLVMAAGLNAAWLHSRGPLNASSVLTHWQAALSLSIWLAVIVCGRWIAYF